MTPPKIYMSNQFKITKKEVNGSELILELKSQDPHTAFWIAHSDSLHLTLDRLKVNEKNFRLGDLIVIDISRVQK